MPVAVYMKTGGAEVCRSPLCRSSHGVEVEAGFVEVVDLGGRVSKGERECCRTPMRRTVVTQEDSEYGSQLLKPIRIASVMNLHAAGSSNDNP